MSDPTDVVVPALVAWLIADTAVIAAFSPKPVKVFDEIVPTNEPFPYGFVASSDPDDDRGDCYDAAIVNLNLDVWARNKADARKIAKAFKASILRAEDTGDSPAISIAGQRLVAVEPITTRYLTDPSDGKTVHAVVEFRLSVDPTV